MTRIADLLQYHNGNMAREIQIGRTVFMWTHKPYHPAYNNGKSMIVIAHRLLVWRTLA